MGIKPVGDCCHAGHLGSQTTRPDMREMLRSGLRFPAPIRSEECYVRSRNAARDDWIQSV